MGREFFHKHVLWSKPSVNFFVSWRSGLFFVKPPIWMACHDLLRFEHCGHKRKVVALRSGSGCMTTHFSVFVFCFLLGTHICKPGANFCLYTQEEQDAVRTRLLAI